MKPMPSATIRSLSRAQILKLQHQQEKIHIHLSHYSPQAMTKEDASNTLIIHTPPTSQYTHHTYTTYLSVCASFSTLGNQMCDVTQTKLSHQATAKGYQYSCTKVFR